MFLVERKIVLCLFVPCYKLVRSRTQLERLNVLKSCTRARQTLHYTWSLWDGTSYLYRPQKSSSVTFQTCRVFAGTSVPLPLPQLTNDTPYRNSPLLDALGLDTPSKCRRWRLGYSSRRIETVSRFARLSTDRPNARPVRTTLDRGKSTRRGFRTYRAMPSSVAFFTLGSDHAMSAKRDIPKTDLDFKSCRKYGFFYFCVWQIGGVRAPDGRITDLFISRTANVLHFV